MNEKMQYDDARYIRSRALHNLNLELQHSHRSYLGVCNLQPMT